MTDPFDIAFKDLPEELPLFPLPRVILLPRIRFPLNIFEPRYLALTRAALSGSRLLGIVQRKQEGDGKSVFKTGCAGRIVSFSETDDGRYLVTLTGVSRFDIAEELPRDPQGFRRGRPNWTPYAADLAPEKESQSVCRDALTGALRVYFDMRGMSCAKWNEMEAMSCERLISTLSVVCPFDTAEKQALLEAATLAARARLLQSFLENEIRSAGQAGCWH
jgi:Lon protease-like protein